MSLSKSLYYWIMQGYIMKPKWKKVQLTHPSDSTMRGRQWPKHLLRFTCVPRPLVSHFCLSALFYLSLSCAFSLACQRAFVWYTGTCFSHSCHRPNCIMRIQATSGHWQSSPYKPPRETLAHQQFGLNMLSCPLLTRNWARGVDFKGA